MNNKLKRFVSTALMSGALCGASSIAHAGNLGEACKHLPSHAQLKAALDAAVAAEMSGFNLHMWATLVNRDGIVCARRVFGR
jgi:hypothetical protein